MLERTLSTPPDRPSSLAVPAVVGTCLGLLAAGVLVVLGVAGTGSSDQAVSADQRPVSDVAQPARDVAEDRGERLEGARNALARRLADLVGTSGVADGSGGRTPFPLGCLGYVRDDDGGFTVVAGAGSDLRRLRTALLQGLPEASASLLRLRHGDVTVARVLDTWRRVTAGGWRTTGRERFTIALHPEEPRIHVRLGEADDRARSRLKAIDPELLDVRPAVSLVRPTEGVRPSS